MPTQKETVPFTIALHPIHDADHRHVADRLHHGAPQHDSDEDLMSVTAKALTSAVYELGDGGLLDDRMLFIDLPLEWLERPELLPTPASRLALSIADTDTVTAELCAHLDAIRERGYRVIISARLFAQAPEALLGRCDILRISSPDTLSSTILERLRTCGVKLLADQCTSQEMLEHFRAMGCDYFDGNYLAQPSFFASPTRGRHGNRAAQMRLIRLLYEENSDLSRMHELLLQLPHLHVAILRRANSSYFNRGGKEVDLQRAVQLLGLIELRRLVMTLTLASLQPSSHIVLRMALIRAFMCRNLATPFSALDPEDAFTTGLFSMMDALMEEDKGPLFDQLPLSQPIVDAIKHRSGPLGELLSLCESHEQQADAAIDQMPGDRLHASYMEALASTASLMDRL